MDWTNESSALSGLEVEICFLLDEQFYTGDPNNAEQLNDPKFKVPLELPDFPRVVPTMVRTTEALPHLDALIRYYRILIEKGLAVGRNFNELRHYFWTRLWFWNTEEEGYISFPWYDSLSEMQQFFSWLKTGPEAAYHDGDQGWELQAVRKGDRLYFRQLDPDVGEELANLSVPFEPFLEAAVATESRALEVVAALSAGIGADVWTQYLRNAKFGTSEWNPLNG